jgi:ATP-dependent helicase HrpB
VEKLVSDKRAVLSAPPGAGKSTAIPISLTKNPAFSNGKIIVLEPRRLAVKQVASRMAQTLGEPLGKTVGYRIRGESKCDEQTKVEVVTEGILIRMIQEDQQLTGISTVIFDEFHERSLNADLGLAFCLEIASVLREDLKILVMSATLEISAVSKLMQGRSNNFV